MPAIVDPVNVVRQSPEWRISIDRAWRDPTTRRDFEVECEIEPLALSGAALREQEERGHVRRYFDLFPVWATRRLKLEAIAPNDIALKIEGQK